MKKVIAVVSALVWAVSLLLTALIVVEGARSLRVPRNPLLPVENYGMLPAVSAVGVLTVLTVISLAIFAIAGKAVVRSRPSVHRVMTAGTALVWLGSVALLMWARHA